jgi:hypothetical protein
VLLAERRNGLGKRSRIDRLGEVELESGLEREPAIFLTRECGDRRSRNRCHVRLAHRADPPHERVSVLARHTNVGEKDVDPFSLEQVECVCGGSRSPDLRVAILKVRRQHLAAVVVVFDD